MTIHLRTTLALGSVALLCACQGEDAQLRTVGFSEVFEQEALVRLEEPDSAPLTGIRKFAPTPDGRFLVVDEGRPQVRVFGPGGELERIVGRHGDGPGEFRYPNGARMDEKGRLFVLEGDGATITRFHPDLTYDSIFELPSASAYDLDMVEAALLTLVRAAPEEDMGRAALVGYDGSLIGRFHPMDSLVQAIPYWSSFGTPLGAAGTDRVVIVNRLFYPLHVYSAHGDALDSFGSPPASWRQPARPERGEFIGIEGFDRLERWLRSMTVISGVQILRDSAVVVVHAIPDPDPTRIFAQTDTLLDAYSIEGEKLLEDIPVPGRVLEGKDYLYVLEAEPPEGWVVGVYRLRTEELDF